jgi:hypothetical protein
MATIDHQIRKFKEIPLSTQLLLSVLKGYKRPYDKISEMVKAGALIPLKRGLYVPGAGLDIKGPHPFLISNHLYGPSYISLESALSYWGLIPERTSTFSAITIRRTTVFNNPIGRFSYTQVPLPYYSFGLMRQLLSGVNLRSVTQTKEYLFDDLRLDEEAIYRFRLSDIRSWTRNSPKQKSLQMLIKTLEA